MKEEERGGRKDVRNIVELGKGESAVDTGQNGSDELGVNVVDSVLLLGRSLPLFPSLLPVPIIPRPLLTLTLLLVLLLLLIVRLLLIRQPPKHITKHLKVNIHHLGCDLALLLLEHDLVQRRHTVVARVVTGVIARRSGDSRLLLGRLLVVRIAAELDVVARRGGCGGNVTRGGRDGGTRVEDELRDLTNEDGSHARVVLEDLEKVVRRLGGDGTLRVAELVDEETEDVALLLGLVAEEVGEVHYGGVARMGKGVDRHLLHREGGVRH